MLVGNLLKRIEKKYQKIHVNGISFDSRKVNKKDIFFAIKGNETTGLKYVKQAVLKGASVIITQEKINHRNYKAKFIVVKDVRRSLAEASSNYYKRKPSNIIAVTGTNGKSSVADFFYQILRLNKIPAASIGTLGVLSNSYKKKIKLTSPDPLFLHKNLQILEKKKINHVILEASSHGLKQKRLDNLNIKVGIFTNLSHDHLDYHKNMKSYFESKMYLFRKLLKKNSTAITDEENKEYKIIKNILKDRKLKKRTIGFKSGSIRILNNRYKENKQIVKILFNSNIFTLEIPLIGFFQVKNLLMAILASLSCGINLNKILSKLNKIRPVPGRLECVQNFKNNSNIIVDFAHTPDALEQSLIALKKQFKKDIIIVFGCGGDRDKKKRSIMGKIAKKYCRKVFITDDNPRNENPKKIRNSIFKGCKNIAVNIGNRKKAIFNAIKELRSNEILLVAGKGHENLQDYGNKIIKFSDKKVIREIVRRNNFINKKNYHQDFLLKKIFNNNIKNIKYNGVSINSKITKKDNLFFCIKGKKNDGHKFAKNAIKKGAVRIVANKKIKQISKNKIIKVKNTFSSLNNLARATRNNTSSQIIGITGSAGKTTLKNLVSFALLNFGKVYHSPHSYNNKFGVPLSLSNLKRDTDFGVFEIGMDKKGEIDNLSKIVKPEIGVITNIAGAHFKNFNSLKDIAKAKGEIINNISKNGIIILNKDDSFFKYFYDKAKKRGIDVISFSSKVKTDIYLKSIRNIKNLFRIKVNVKGTLFYFDISNSANNFIYNVLACIGILHSLNLDLKKIQIKLKKFKLPTGRGDVKTVKKFKKTFKFIDESYNANPLSMSSAIKNMTYYKRKNNLKKIVLLGDMLELGKKSKKLHKDLSVELNKSDIDKVFVYGKYIKETFKSLSKSKKGKVFNNFKEINNHFSKIINNNDLLMIKGSNATGLNQFSRNIKKDQRSAI